ncbi:MAG: MoaD/ThiS family protein [Gammaproteobacteria bacterium]|nr:MoaD/ThiS family protein [Gammaproteobacteria bacterium]MXY58210.1 MoaD/ThiS family protein [Gammaproteobacteria bacterium]MYF27372.1 MoaD/ThiS family protein [Gammaproteobacteria bacterium]MYK46084.1 MoaD/ThiS family protein [Gammaproteobacteria bacterium]
MSSATSAVVAVRFFGSLREAVGLDALALDVEDACISGVRARLASVLCADALRALSGQGVRVCVNQTIIRGNVELRPGDEVAFLPPVTGG